MRYSLRELLVVMAFAAMIGGGYAWIAGLYYSQLRRVSAVLAEHPEIDQVFLSTNDDVTLEVEELHFTVTDRPEVALAIVGIDGASKSEIRKKLEQALAEQRPVVPPSYVTLQPTKVALRLLRSPHAERGD